MSGWANCEICQIGTDQGASLFRQNEKGKTGIWRCDKHNKKPVDDEVREIVNIIEKGDKND